MKKILLMSVRVCSMCVCVCGLFVVDSLDGPSVEQVSEDGAR